MRKKEKQLWKHLVSLFLALIILVLIQPGYVQAASSYTADWQRWSQGASGYSAMKYGCRVTAYSKMLAEAGYAGFGNPDGFFEWGMARGYFRASDTCELTSIGVAPVTYVNNSGGAASLVGRQALTGNKTTDANTIMNLINQGYYVVLTCTEHTAYVGRAASLSQGTAVLLDSWSSRKEGPSFQYRSYTQYTFKTANYFRITTNSTPADTTPPVISDVRVTDMNADGYTVTCRVEDAGGVARVQFPTWTTYGDQDDLMASWWDSDRCRGTQNGTTWSYRVNASDHNNEEGYYNTHIYAWDAAGNSSYVHVNGIYVDRTPPVISEVQVVDADATGYTVTCRVEDAVGVERVQFPTWTTYGDQDDLMASWWDSDRCRGTQNGTTWSYRVNASDHNNEEGYYNTHIYVWDAAGNSSYVHVNGIYVDRTPPVISEVKVVDVDATGYTVTCKVEDSSSGIMKVQFPTWTPENGQDDLAECWWDNPICSGTQNGTTWSYRVNVSDHNNEEGVYRTHIYAYDNAGNRTGAMEVADVLVEKAQTETVKASNVHLSRTSLTWNGKRQRPSVIAKDSQGRQIGSADYTITYSNNKNAGQATAIITFKNNYTGTVRKTFLIKPKGTSISRLTPKKKGFAIKWRKQASQITGYELQYCANSKFKGARTLKNIKAQTTSKSVTKLKAKKKYYVRIRTYKNARVNGKSVKIYSGWSKAKKVTAKK